MNHFNNIALRKEIQKIVDSCFSEKAVDEQAQQIENLKKTFPHSITLKETVRSIGQHNCHAQTLELFQFIGYLEIAKNGLFANADFMNYLIESNFLKEIENKNIKSGDYILYLSEDITHSGTFLKDKIISKWGNVHLWEHKIFEIPIRYGNIVKFFKKLDKQIIWKQFLTYKNLLDQNPLADKRV